MICKKRRPTNSEARGAVSDNVSSSSSASSSSSSSEETDIPVKRRRAQRKKPRQTQGKQAVRQKKAKRNIDKSDRRVDRLISEALKSHKREQNRDIINSLRSQLMKMLCSAVSGAPVPPTGTGRTTDDDVTNNHADDIDSKLSAEYLSCIKRAHKKDADEAKFNSSQHKSLIKSLLNNVTDI